MTLQAPMQCRARQMRDRRLQSVKASAALSSGSNVCRLKATIIAFSALSKTVDRGSFGPVLRSSTVRRLRHFVTVLGLMPSSRLSVASEACDHSGQALGPMAGQPLLLQL